MDDEKILHLTLKKKFFDLILNGVKKEEYRTVNPYWFVRFIDNKHEFNLKEFDIKDFDDEFSLSTLQSLFEYKKFDYIEFYNGGSPSLKYPNFSIEFKGFSIGPAVPEWSDNWPGKVFILKLGEIIQKDVKQNC